MFIHNLSIIKIVIFSLLSLLTERIYTQQTYILAGDTFDVNQNIIYHNIVDISISNGSDYKLDINNDNINDFNFTTVYYTGTSSTVKGCNVSSYNNNAVSLVDSGSTDPKITNINDQIGNNCYWGEDYYNLIYDYVNHVPPFGSGSSGIWWNVNDKYIGVKLVIDSRILYGWIKISVNSDLYSTTIKEYAVQSYPQAIESNEINDYFGSS